MRIGGRRTVGLVLVGLAAARVVDRAVPGSHLAVGLGLTPPAHRRGRDTVLAGVRLRQHPH
jgi:hypothetical protein